MNETTSESLILSIDDDGDTLQLIERLLTSANYKVITATGGSDGLRMAASSDPDLILLDVNMPEMDGYEVCERLQEDKQTASIPVVFVTGTADEQDKAKAFTLGAVDYLLKPVQKKDLLLVVSNHIDTHAKWKKLHATPIKWDDDILSFDFMEFREYLYDKLDSMAKRKSQLLTASPADIYAISSEDGIKSTTLAQHIAEFLGLPFITTINPEDIQSGVISPLFSKSHFVVPVKDDVTSQAFVISNPFDWELIETLKQFSSTREGPKLLISAPDNIARLFTYGSSTWQDDAPSTTKKSPVTKPEKSAMEKQPIIFIADGVVEGAMSAGASDIHIEPKESSTVVRFRVDGDLRDFTSLKKETGVQLIARFKVLGSLDLSESRKPQDGAFVEVVHGEEVNFRLSTSSTPYGESLVMRLLEPYAEVKDLRELGMTAEQAQTLKALINRHSGSILIVGPTGSGKTTTIYSVLHGIDYKARSLVSIEDPVEYRIPFANQQQVNEKAGVTFEALLKAAVRQDPDILFMGEVRDQHSAKVAMDFASTGHLTITSLHTSNATTAISRLERLGTSRGVMAEAISAISAQRLLKKLCPFCKETVPISEEEIEMLSPFTNDIPSMVAHPVGCHQCNDIGYRGREGIYEILEFTAEISGMVRNDASIAEIRSFVYSAGGYLASTHAIEKVRDLVFSPSDVYEAVLIEETELKNLKALQTSSKFLQQAEEVLDPHPHLQPDNKITVSLTEGGDTASILVVEDDEDTRKLITQILEKQGYTVAYAVDGLDAMLLLDKQPFDLVLSDVNMPNLDGFKLMEIMIQKGIDTPVIFLTARESAQDEEAGLTLGAIDYLRKPINKEVLLLRVKRALRQSNKVGG
ncbi:MAG: Flp pilus assembly complex ATPase component TadA [Chloroflexi bacterium]|nr:Flp pilus assembly complex ATPase component TadA [Chloroflexota bacterium]